MQREADLIRVARQRFIAQGSTAFLSPEGLNPSLGAGAVSLDSAPRLRGPGYV